MHIIIVGNNFNGCRTDYLCLEWLGKCQPPPNVTRLLSILFRRGNSKQKDLRPYISCSTIIFAAELPSLLYGTAVHHNTFNTKSQNASPRPSISCECANHFTSLHVYNSHIQRRKRTQLVKTVNARMQLWHAFYPSSPDTMRHSNTISVSSFSPLLLLSPSQFAALVYRVQWSPVSATE